MSLRLLYLIMIRVFGWLLLLGMFTWPDGLSLRPGYLTSRFGSRVRGTARPDSDIDILYTLRPGRRLGWEIEQLADQLAELFGRQVDLVSVRALHPLLRPSVLAEARPLYAA